MDVEQGSSTPSRPIDWGQLRQNVEEYLAQTAGPSVVGEAIAPGTVETKKHAGILPTHHKGLTRLIAGIPVIVGLAVGGVRPADSQADAKPSLTPTPQGISRHLPDNFPSAQKEYQRTVTAVRTAAETSAKTEQAKGVDFTTVDLAASGSLENPGNRLVGLVRTTDGYTHVAVMDLDQMDLSAGVLLMKEVYKVPFAGQGVAVDPQDPNKIMVFGLVVKYYGSSSGMLAAASDGLNFTPAEGAFGLMSSSQIIDGVGFVTQAFQQGVMLAKYSFAEKRIVDNIKITGIAPGYSPGTITPLIPAQSGYIGRYSRMDSLGYAILDINGGATGQYVNIQQGTPGGLLFWVEGIDKIVSQMTNDTTAPGDENQSLPTVYIDKNDSLQNKFQPDWVDFYAQSLPVGITMSAFTYNPLERNYYTSISVTKLPMSQNASQYFIEIVPRDDPNNLAKRKVIIPMINGQQITTSSAGAGINNIHISYINREEYLVFSNGDDPYPELGGGFPGLFIAKMPVLTGKTTNLEFTAVKLQLQPRLFLPLVTRP